MGMSGIMGAHWPTPSRTAGFWVKRKRGRGAGMVRKVWVVGLVMVMGVMGRAMGEGY